MPPKIGTIVRSDAGRDKGMFMIVLSANAKTVTLCDGKERPLERPKVKNIRHISCTNCCVSEEQMTTNKSVRHALSNFRATMSKE